MTLRTTYSGALDAALIAARNAGQSLVTTNLSTISAAMSAAAASGLKSFVYTAAVSYQPADIRKLGKLWAAFSTGIESQLSSEDIMFDEITVALNTSDQTILKVDLNFSF